MNPAISSSEVILNIASAFQKSRVILTAFELEIFTVIGASSFLPEDIAAAICAPARSTVRLLNALCALGLLNKEKGLFSNTAVSARFLVKGSEEYLSRIGHMINLYRSWGTLTEAVRAGGSVTEKEYDEASLARFIEAMHQRAGKSAPELISHIDLVGVERILDVGGGSGVYSMAFARSKPGLRAVVFDLPQVIMLAEKYIAEGGLTERVTTMNGDYNADDFGTGYDLVFMSAIIHINSPEENQALINRAFASLNPGGRIVIQDHIMEEDRTAPVRGALFSLNMLVNTMSGNTYTEREMRDWLAKAGCHEIQRISTGMENDLMVGKKRK
jgi:2-polyprenyl-3-methyl-5-hydroxy-6-metoxy-1,4-benzoquinol methylase